MAPILVFMTTGSRREAQRIAQALLEKHLIACANIYGPIESHFWWQGKIEKAKEFLVLMKSHRNLFSMLSETVKKMHGHDVPEILGVSIVEGFQPYLEWLDSILGTSGES